MKRILALAIVLFALNVNAQKSNNEEQSYSKLYNDGTSLIGEKKFKEALDLFQKALAIKNNSAEAVFARGTCYLMLNERDKACSDFSRAKELKYSAADDYILKYCGKEAIGRKQKPLHTK
jgi:Flp pilus assembly protein TadD